ncbi:MAG TPA: hypothetical protein H9815_13670 [Candidatus Ruania gallistercoris]|uniref:Uncharacterized protein n=1 Tax=Candidatus Ruania gallistercoris TaxID=2838746 RepID=A0A9D2J506_9MICO|nr:hypothetical protein [Candidatus Ruania gallistercoris]
MRSGRGLVPAAVLLLAAACTPDAGTGQGEDPPSSISVDVSAEEPTEIDETVVEVEADRPSQESDRSSDGTDDAAEGLTEEPPAPPTGPQLCGTVTTTIGDVATVEIIAGDVDCASAEALLDTYYNDPPSIPEGSGAYLMIEDWECNSSSSQEPGRLSTCRSAADAEVIAIAGEASEGGWCAQIDDATLEQLFADGEQTEAVCATYIGAETSVDEQ